MPLNAIKQARRARAEGLERKSAPERRGF